MLDVLTSGFRNARMMMAGRAELNEETIKDALREVRSSLIQADVELGVARDFVARVQGKVSGTQVQLKDKRTGMQLTPADWFVKACYDELVLMMGPEGGALDLTGKPAVVMLVGLQGSGKTTTAGKLARLLMRDGRKPMLVAADIYRPAAVDQLMVLGRKLAVPVFSIRGMDPVKLSKLAVAQARQVGRDVVIIDTAGRLALDEALMQEVVDIKATIQPSDVLFVCDAMMGQDAVRTASEFDRRLDFTGFILTKMDGDARGGAALAIKAVTGKPVKFLGQGEGLDQLEAFRPEGVAQRILGMGDVVGLVQDFERHVDKDTAAADAERILAGTFGYDDFVKQLRTIRKMGPIREIMAKLPFMSDMLAQLPEDAIDEGELDVVVAVINSMTNQERKNPDILNDSRFKRIARGSGHTLAEVKDLHQRFVQARAMMSGLGSMMRNPAQFRALQQQAAQMQRSGAFPGMGAFGAPGAGMPNDDLPTETAEERERKRKLKKKQKDARKKNRK
jgi:signal recognition particle subunit SRP54